MVHIYTSIRACVHIYICMYTYACGCVCKGVYTCENNTHTIALNSLVPLLSSEVHFNTYIHLCECVHICIYAYIHTRVGVYVRAFMDSNIHTCVCV